MELVVFVDMPAPSSLVSPSIGSRTEATNYSVAVVTTWLTSAILSRALALTSVL